MQNKAQRHGQATRRKWSQGAGMIEFENVSKSFWTGKTRKVILDRASFRVELGNSLGILARNGSGKTFLKAIGEFAAKSSHPELETVPWTLWGHSGGGSWVGGMQALHPERIVAIWFRSGRNWRRNSAGNSPRLRKPNGSCPSAPARWRRCWT